MNKEVAARFGVTPQMVGKWRARFVTDRLGGLTDSERSGRPRTVTDEQVEQVVTATLEQAPQDGGTHWSTRLMATRTGLSQTAVSRIWRAFELKPHRVDYWKLSTDPHFVDKLYDVVGLYLDPPERALVLCVDEKSQVQALYRSAPLLPMMPADPARQTHDYQRQDHRVEREGQHGLPGDRAPQQPVGDVRRRSSRTWWPPRPRSRGSRGTAAASEPGNCSPECRTSSRM